MKKALIIVDLQNDFLPNGALAVPHGHELIPIANDLMPLFDCVVATQDWHPAQHGSFAVNQPPHHIGDRIDWNGLPQILWPVHCVQHTYGAAFAEHLTLNNVLVFQKGTDPEVDSYSGFFDNGKRNSTGLGAFLEQQGITDVYVMGLALDYCVKFTALDALYLGFRTHLIADACRAVNLQPTDGEQAIANIVQAGGNIVSSPYLLGKQA